MFEFGVCLVVVVRGAMGKSWDPLEQPRRAAFEEIGFPRPHCVIDARCYYDFDPSRRTSTDGHIGSHPVLMDGVLKHKCFAGHLRDVARATSISADDPFVVAVYCRAGEKRSVAMSVYVYHWLRYGNGWNGSMQHLNRWAWQWKTCEGCCAECTDLTDRRGAPYMEQALAWWQQARRE
ncbi:MAG: hypothetical protein GY772_30745 [bacterium]|nr:hypothetical protein [bacterium]